jgi:sulfite dehydrogenase
VLALVTGTVGLAACGGDDDNDASEAVESAQSQAASIQSQVGDQVDSALSQAASVQSQVGDQVESALSQATAAASEATSEDTGGGSESAAAGGDATAGKAVFTGPAGCAGCHTLADAGATGAVGPNLDDVKPDMATVVQFVTNGSPPMPSFKGTLSDADIQNVAAYVSSVAGQ